MNLICPASVITVLLWVTHYANFGLLWALSAPSGGKGPGRAGTSEFRGYSMSACTERAANGSYLPYLPICTALTL